MSARRVMIMAGGTGGHIFPGLAVAAELRKTGCEVVWLGTPRGLENRLVPEAGIELERVGITGLRGRGAAGWLAAPWRILRATVQARRILRRRRPGCVLSMGGYAAGPGGLAARLMGLPLVVHEQNAVPGLTNRVLARLARRVFCGFPDSLRGGSVSGNPVRADIEALPAPAERYAARTGPLRLLVIGGSQGAGLLNTVVPRAVAAMDAGGRPLIRHQSGATHLETTRERYCELGVEADVRPFIGDMATAWSWADLAVCRAGALTVAEIAAAGVASLLVPLAVASDDHQTANARYLAAADAAWLFTETAFLPAALAALLGRLERAELAARAVRARSRARPGAAAAVARGCLEAAA